MEKWRRDATLEVGGLGVRLGVIGFPQVVKRRDATRMESEPIPWIEIHGYHE
ncbi:hypothetical protein [Haloferula sp.]|uniref:hypothetical protein n=1 Tax=Haloferula sp. TaxID=2497595 RepID=UPI003C736E83